MDYYKLLDFYTEPFSNSPDPEFFFESSSHVDCLQKLEISIRLRRGLCVVLGDVGAGKTTLSRKLIRDLKTDPDIETYLILDPTFMSTLEMMSHLSSMFRAQDSSQRPPSTETGYKEIIKNHLFHKAVQEEKSIVLIIDEGQKMSSACLEILRELLNFETNDQKLLQIIIFAQNEFQDILDQYSNFADRVNLLCRIAPLNLQETAGLIMYRIQKASDYESSRRPKIKFTKAAIKKIYQITRGHPRKIINLCHRLLMLVIVSNKCTITSSMVVKSVQNLPGSQRAFVINKSSFAIAGGIVAMLILVTGYLYSPQIRGFLTSPHEASHIEDPADIAHTVRMTLDLTSEDQVQENHQETEDFDDIVGLQLLFDSASLSADDNEDYPETVTIPQNLGSITISRNENLWSILELVYGKADLHLLRRASAANPHIQNLDRLQNGEKITLPIVNSRKPSDDEVFWIVVETYSDLNKAYNSTMDTDRYRLRVLPFVDYRSQVHYCVAWLISFDNESEALESINNLPDNIAQKARVLSLDDEDILLF